MKDKCNVMIELTGEDAKLYAEYTEIVKKEKHINLMWHNKDMFINGMKEIVSVSIHGKKVKK